MKRTQAGHPDFALVLALLLTLLVPLGCGERPGTGLPDGAQAISLLGDTLFPPEVDAETLQTRSQQLEEALADLEAEPDGADALIWAGRRQAYLGEYREAIEIFSRGIDLHPTDARFFRHRGHRYISVREFDNAISDFRSAAELIQGQPDEVEPDGQPNARGVPTSTLQFNIWYHYGLAHYLKGEFEAAAEKYQTCMEVSKNPDSRVATAHWLYMSLRRLGRDQDAAEVIAAIDFGEEVIENDAYLNLLRLYAGGVGPLEPELGLGEGSSSGAAVGYGVGNWYLYGGEPESARRTFQQIVDARDQWAAFGYIAAEAELARDGGGA
jgi:tetratricopeptide (TPR) repeat protein